MPIRIMFIDPFIGGAMIAGGATLAAGGASIAANANLNKKNRKWQEKMVREQREYEQQVYDQRYSPSAQAYNLRAAGINPIGNTQTMNVGTSSSTPTPATTPADFSSIGEAGQAIASGLHARQAMKLEQAKFNQQVTEENRRFLLDLKTSELNAEETRAIINSKIEELESLKLDNETKRLNKQMLEDFINAGGNTYSDQSQQIQASVALAKKEYEYYDQNQQLIADRYRAEINSLNSSARNSLASAKNTEYHNITDKHRALVSQVVGFDISILPPGAQGLISGYVSSYANGDISAEKCSSAVKDILDKLSKSETYVQGNMSFSGGLTSVSTSQSFNANQ